MSCWQNDLAPLSIFEHAVQSVKFKEVKLKVKLCPFYGSWQNM
jgi:hypothetical protein